MTHDMDRDDADHAADVPQARVSGRFMFAYAFAQYAFWLALLTPVILTLALKVDAIATPDQKGRYLGTILSIGAFCALVAAPVWGTISDRSASRFGRRRPWILVGSLAILAGLSIMAVASTLPVLTVGWMVCQIGSNAGQAALNAITADVVPPAQRGRMSGLLGLTLPLSYVSGSFLTQFTNGNPVALFIVPWLPMLVAVPWLIAMLPDRPARARSRRSWAGELRSLGVNPLRHPDFGWAFSSRFMMTLAIGFFQAYQVYFLIDYLGIARADVATSMFKTTLVTAALTLIFTPASGWLSDRIGRLKPFVIVAALIVALGMFGISTSTRFQQFLIAVVVVGIGKGVYYAVDYALCIAVLPSRESAAKDMGIIQIANSLPQSLAPAIAPVFLTIGAGQNYPAVYLAAMGAAIIGALAILPIRGVR